MIKVFSFGIVTLEILAATPDATRGCANRFRSRYLVPYRLFLSLREPFVPRMRTYPNKGTFAYVTLLGRARVSVTSMENAR